MSKIKVNLKQAISFTTQYLIPLFKSIRDLFRKKK